MKPPAELRGYEARALACEAGFRGDLMVKIGDVLATLCAALGVPPETENTSNTGRPIKIVEGYPIEKLLA